MSTLRRALMAQGASEPEKPNLAVVSYGKCNFSTPNPRNWWPIGVKAKVEQGKKYDINFNWKFIINKLEMDDSVTTSITINCKYANPYQLGGEWGLTKKDIGVVKEHEFSSQSVMKKNQDGTDEWFFETQLFKPKNGYMEGIIEVYNLVITEA